MTTRERTSDIYIERGCEMLYCTTACDRRISKRGVTHWLVTCGCWFCLSSNISHHNCCCSLLPTGVRDRTVTSELASVFLSYFSPRSAYFSRSFCGSGPLFSLFVSGYFIYILKGSSWKYKTEKSLTNYSLCTVRQFVFSHKTILTVIRIDNNSLWQSPFQWVFFVPFE